MTMLYLMPVPTSTSYVLHRLTFSYGCHHGSFAGARGEIACVRAQRVGTVAQQPMPVTPQTTPRPARAAAPRVRGGSNGLRASSDDGRAWPNQRRGRPNAAGQPSYRRRGSRVPRSCLARAVDAGVCHRTRPTRRRQALCLARSPLYNVRSRSDDLAGAHSPPPPAAAQRQHGEGSRSRTSWQARPRRTKNGQ